MSLRNQKCTTKVVQHEEWCALSLNYFQYHPTENLLENSSYIVSANIFLAYFSSGYDETNSPSNLFLLHFLCVIFITGTFYPKHVLY